MKKLGLLLLLALSVSSHGESINPLASARMKELVPDPERSIKTDRTYVFARSQWKYGLQRNDYLNFWIDRPLYVDPSLRENQEAKISGLSHESFTRTAEIVKRYGLDGLAFFPETGGRDLVFKYAAEKSADGFQLLTEFSPGTYRNSKLDVLRTALNNPASFRIDGKLVVTSYNADKLDLEAWKKELESLREALGNQFLFLPALSRFGTRPLHEWAAKYHSQAITPAEIEAIKEDLRRWLRLGDGLHFAAVASVKTKDRHFDEAFYRDFVIRLMKSVLAEPEFSGKYFGLAALVGHENITRLGYTHSCDGTKTLRRSIEAALAAEPEILNIPEWDEQNENTSLRPTIYNGTSSMRILRHYMSKVRGVKETPLPEDDLETPNLVASYRKIVVLGEKLEVELLNIPDGSGDGSYTARLTLEDLDGKELYTSPEVSFQKEVLKDHTVTIPSETLAASQVLVPRLELVSGDKAMKFSDGLHYIELRPTSNWDYKWVKQPLRDLLKPRASEFEISDADAEGIRTVKARFETDEPLAYLEVLDNDDVVYSHSEGDEWREDAEKVVLSLYWQGSEPSSKAIPINGQIELRNGEGRWLLPTGTNAPTLNGNMLEGLRISLKPQRVLVAIPRSALDKAELAIDLPGVYQGTFPVSKIVDEKSYGIPIAGRSNLVISRYLRQYEMPLRMNSKSASFTTRVLPDLTHSVFHLQAVGVSGRLYRSKPIRIGKRSEKGETVTVYSDTEKSPITVSVDSEQVPVIRYAFDARRGSVFPTDAGRAFSGILGDRTNLVMERGGGQSGDGTPFFTPSDYPQNATQAAPSWITLEDGGNALKFDGVGTFAVLPQGVIPRRAAFTITMELRPDRQSGREVIIANRANYPGSLTVYRENGILKADFLGFNGKSVEGGNSGLLLPAGEWSRLEIRYNQRDLVLSVNGKSGRPIRMEGPGSYDTVSLIGGFGDAWFKGEIKSLEIRHDVDLKTEKEDIQ